MLSRFFGRRLPGFYLKLLELLSFIMTISTDALTGSTTFSMSSLFDHFCLGVLAARDKLSNNNL